MARPRKDQPREILSLSLPPDLAEELHRRSQVAGISKAQYLRQLMSIGMTVKDDLSTLARAVRDVRAHPDRYSTSVKVSLREVTEEALQSSEIDRSRLLPGDLEDLEGYRLCVGPYEVRDGMWVCGPFTTKIYGEVWDYMVSDDEWENTGSHVRIQNRIFRLACHLLELDQKPYFVYTNAEMTPSAINLFRENIMRTWDKIVSHG